MTGQQQQVVVDVAPSIPWDLVAIIVVISAAVSWALVAAIEKTAAKKIRYDDATVTAREATRRLWWSPMLAIVRVLLGFGVGAGFGAVDWSLWYGGAAGALGGALAVTVVSATKGSLRTVIGRIGGKAKPSGDGP